ncbi:hypothetical protein ACI8AC_25160 [Geodermatophilus sp. SYSU D00758]
MSESNMTGRPAGGTNEPTEGVPGERPEHDEVGAAPEQSPRAAQDGTMSSDQGTPGVPGSATGPSSAGPPDAAPPGD